MSGSGVRKVGGSTYRCKALVLPPATDGGRARPYRFSLLDLPKIPAFRLSIALFRLFCPNANTFFHPALMPSAPSPAVARVFFRTSSKKGPLVGLREVS